MDISLYGVFTCTYILGNLLLPLDKSDCRCIIVLPFKNKCPIKDTFLLRSVILVINNCILCYKKERASLPKMVSLPDGLYPFDNGVMMCSSDLIVMDQENCMVHDSIILSFFLLGNYQISNSKLHKLITEFLNRYVINLCKTSFSNW